MVRRSRERGIHLPLAKDLTFSMFSSFSVTTFFLHWDISLDRSGPRNDRLVHVPLGQLPQMLLSSLEVCISPTNFLKILQFIPLGHNLDTILLNKRALRRHLK